MSCNRRLERSKGVVLIEAAIALPVAFLIFIGVRDLMFSQEIYHKLNQVLRESLVVASAATPMPADFYANGVNGYPSLNDEKCLTATNPECIHAAIDWRVQKLIEAKNIKVDLDSIRVESRFYGSNDVSIEIMTKPIRKQSLFAASIIRVKGVGVVTSP